MSDVLAPPQFNEAFTLYLNTEGQPVERPLRDMTAGEVLVAMDWYQDEVERAERAVQPFVEMTAAMEAGTVDPNTTGAQIKAAVAGLRQTAELQSKAGRLGSLVQSNMPQWRRHPEVKMREALRRWWPGGRA